MEKDTFVKFKKSVNYWFEMGALEDTDRGERSDRPSLTTATV